MEVSAGSRSNLPDKRISHRTESAVCRRTAEDSSMRCKGDDDDKFARPADINRNTWLGSFAINHQPAGPSAAAVSKQKRASSEQLKHLLASFASAVASIAQASTAARAPSQSEQADRRRAHSLNGAARDTPICERAKSISAEPKEKQELLASSRAIWLRLRLRQSDRIGWDRLELDQAPVGRVGQMLRLAVQFTVCSVSSRRRCW